FRLLAGLTSWRWSLWLSHFSDSGPEGTFDLSSMSVTYDWIGQNAGERREGDRDIADEDDRGDDRADGAERGVVHRAVDAEGLQRARDAVRQVHRQRNHR